MAIKLALIGAPNCGKSTLFNGLTGGRAKTANYAGVTIDIKKGKLVTPAKHELDIYDLPGIYGLTARSGDEKVALEMLEGQFKNESAPDLLLALIDAANIRTHLHSALQLKQMGIPMILVLNMIDLAKRDGLEIDIAYLEKETGLKTVTCRATRDSGREEVIAAIDEVLVKGLPQVSKPEPIELKTLQANARKIAAKAIIAEGTLNKATRIIDSVALHPIIGPILLATILFFMFQAVFTWASVPMDMIETGIASLGDLIGRFLPDGLFKDLLINGIIAGVGSVVIFLPQIIILFAFILVLEASGYMARAAFLMDEIMHRAGLNGRAFIPLLSSFACAIPGIMSARVIEHDRDRLTTILIAPLMTCSARLPVYTLIIAAFIPNTKVWGFGLQGLIMFGLYFAGVISAFIVAFVFKRTFAKGESQALIMEMPTYKLPNINDFFLGILNSAKAFLSRAGTVILYVSIVLWALVTFPLNNDGLKNSYAGMIGSIIEPILKPIGFNLEMSIALIPGFAAREVAVGALSTIYAVTGGEENIEGLSSILRNEWALPTALAFLTWYIFAPQCFATLATIRRETNSWKWAGFAFAYLTILAYIMSFLVYNISKAIIGV